MQVAKGGQRHDLQLATDEGARLVVDNIGVSCSEVASAAKVKVVVVVVVVVFARALEEGSVRVRVPERGEAVVPEVMAEVGLEVVHEGPVQLSVAFREEAEVLQATLQQLRAREVGVGVGGTPPQCCGVVLLREGGNGIWV